MAQAIVNPGPLVHPGGLCDRRPRVLRRRGRAVCGSRCSANTPPCSLFFSYVPSSSSWSVGMGILGSSIAAASSSADWNPTPPRSFQSIAVGDCVLRRADLDAAVPSPPPCSPDAQMTQEMHQALPASYSWTVVSRVVMALLIVAPGFAAVLEAGFVLPRSLIWGLLAVPSDITYRLPGMVSFGGLPAFFGLGMYARQRRSEWSRHPICAGAFVRSYRIASRVRRSSPIFSTASPRHILRAITTHYFISDFPIFYVKSCFTWTEVTAARTLVVPPPGVRLPGLWTTGRSRPETLQLVVLAVVAGSPI